MIHVSNFDSFANINKPQRFTRYFLIWCTEGVAEVMVDGKSFLLPPSNVLTITSGQVFYFKNYESAKGVILEFTYDFFCKNDKDVELIFENGLFCHFDMNEVIPIDNPSVIDTHVALIEEELKNQPYQRLVAVAAIERNRNKFYME